MNGVKLSSLVTFCVLVNFNEKSEVGRIKRVFGIIEVRVSEVLMYPYVITRDVKIKNDLLHETTLSNFDAMSFLVDQESPINNIDDGHDSSKQFPLSLTHTSI